MPNQTLTPHDKVPTYQALLDEALEDTFPASDPIAVSAASQPKEEVPTPRDDKDWTLEPTAPPSSDPTQPHTQPHNETEPPAADSLGRAIASPVLDAPKPPAATPKR